VDLVQLECISQSSSVLRITNGPFTGCIWVNNGDLTDAETEGARGEDAFQKILRWKAGNFEFLPAEPNRARTIFKSYNALLLETAQAIDESGHADTPVNGENGAPAQNGTASLTALAETDGVEFVLKTTTDNRVDSRGLENPERLAGWTRKSLERFRVLGETLHVGAVEQITGLGMQRHIALARKSNSDVCVGWQHTLNASEIRDRMKKVLTLWAS
jgi:hypothetical protein